MKKIIIYLIVAAVLAGAGYFVWRDMATPEAGESVNNKPAMETGGKTATITGEKPEEVKEISINVPGFDKITIDAGITGTAREKLTADFDAAIKMLKTNSLDTIAWNQLGILRQNAKDYSGAIVAWQFVSELSAQSATPLLNIANTYGYYLHDNVRAAEYFKKAIAADSKDGYAYFKAYEFYTDINESAKARSVLEQGVAANPTNTQLKATLDFLNQTK